MRLRSVDVGSLLLCMLLSACSSSDPLEGKFVGRGGQIPVVFHAGHYHSTAIGDGTYTVDGNSVSLKQDATGRLLTGAFVDRDTVRLTHADGVLAPNPIELARAR